MANSVWCNRLLMTVSILSVLISSSYAQADFNMFKSYKDKPIKPPHYGKSEKRSFHISEYLTPQQVRMMRHRVSTIDHPTAKFKSNWSGLNTQPNKRTLRDTIVDDSRSSDASMNDSVRWMVFLISIFSFGWLSYIYLSRFLTIRSVRSDLEKLYYNSDPQSNRDKLSLLLQVDRDREASMSCPAYTV